MNNLCTLLNNLAKNTINTQQLDDLCNLVTTVVKDDLGSDSKSLIASWPQNNYGECLDFFFALRPDWLVGTPDNKQVKMCISIDTCEQSWCAHLVMDCENGECEEWGEKEFTSAELEEYAMPVKRMIFKIYKQYEKKLHEENAKSDVDLDKAAQVAKQLQKHVDAITTLCMKSKIHIYADCSIDGTNCLYLVPDSMRYIDDDDDGEAVDLEKIPYLDLGARCFDSNCDKFAKIK